MNEYSDFHSESIGGESTPHKDIPTPETEAFAHQIRGLGTGSYQAIEFARSLEQRIFIAQADCAAMRVALEGMFGDLYTMSPFAFRKEKEG